MTATFFSAFLAAFSALAKLGIVAFFAGLLVRKKIISQGLITRLSRLTVAVLVPCLIFANVIKQFDPKALPLWWLIPVAVVGGMGGLIFWWRCHRLREVLVKPLSPRELAYQELQQLIDNGLAESDVKLFYVHLTGIVRRYIERSSGVRAPEQTTEEFLHEIGASKVFTRDERRRLQGFLEAADLVKYAAHEPGKTDIEEAFGRAQVFMGLVQRPEVAA